MGGEDDVCPVFRQQFAKARVADAPARLFQPRAPRGGEGGDVFHKTKQGHARARAQRIYKGGVLLRGAAADAVLDVHGGERDSVGGGMPHAPVEQGDGVAPARKGDADAPAPPGGEVDVHGHCSCFWDKKAQKTLRRVFLAQNALRRVFFIGKKERKDPFPFQSL